MVAKETLDRPRQEVDFGLGVPGPQRSPEPEIGQSGPSGCWGDVGKPDQHVVSEVELLLADLRLLMRHVVRRRDRSPRLLPANSNSGISDQSNSNMTVSRPDRDTGSRTETLTLYADLLTADPAGIAHDAGKLQRLYEGIDTLTASSTPANVNSIRLTCAYIASSELGPLPDKIRREAGWLRRFNMVANGIGVLAFAVAVMMLIFVDAGRRDVQNLQEHRSKFLELVAAADNLRSGRQSGTETPYELVCSDDKAIPAQKAQTIQEMAICNQMNDALTKMGLDYGEIRSWNGTALALSRLSPLSWISSSHTPAPDDTPSRQQWESTELRTATAMSGLTGFILPLLLGSVGASVYVFRMTDERIRTWTLEAGDGQHAVVRVLLGGMVGGLVGVIWTSGDTVSLQGFNLSLGAVALLVGFATDIVFGALDRLVHLVTDKIDISRG